MSESPHMKKLLCLIAALGLLAVIWKTLPEFWFRQHLSQEWNVDATERTAGLKSSRRHRLCLIFALDGVPYETVQHLQQQGFFKDFYPHRDFFRPCQQFHP